MGEHGTFGGGLFWQWDSSWVILSGLRSSIIDGSIDQLC
jgi:hypothetical protein